MKKDVVYIHTDGGSRGNPGPAARAYVVQFNGKVIEKKSKYLGFSTNNKAEYEGVIMAITWLLNDGGELLGNVNNNIIFLLDSELVVKQLNGLYKVKDKDLQILSYKIYKLKSKFNNELFFKHIPREKNKLADFLVNKELDKQK